jgi:hypothetical protein
MKAHSHKSITHKIHADIIPSSIATQIKKSIEELYMHNGVYYSPKSDDISNHLKSDKINNNFPAPHKHTDYTESLDESLIVFFYSDNSVLLIDSGGIDSPF